MGPAWDGGLLDGPSAGPGVRFGTGEGLEGEQTLCLTDRSPTQDALGGGQQASGLSRGRRATRGECWMDLGGDTGWRRHSAGLSNGHTFSG